MAGRHRISGGRVRVSGWVIAAVVLVLALIAAVTAWLALRDEDHRAEEAADKECIEGELVLPVAELTPGVADRLIADYAATGPVVRDHCVRPELTDDVKAAAVLVAVDSPAADAALNEAGRSRGTGQARPVAEQAVGLATDGTVDPGSVAADTVVYPVAEQPDAAVAAAAGLAADDAAAEKLLERDRRATVAGADGRPVAVVESAAPKGRTFTALPQTTLTYSAIPLAPADASGAEEETTRAADDFAAFAGDNAEGAEDSAGAKGTEGAEASGPGSKDRAGARQRDALYAAAGVTGAASGGAETHGARDAADKPVETIFLLDTSSAAAPFVGAAAGALGDAAEALAADDHQVALWNYSSPLNPGVTQPWRSNLGFGSGGEVRGVVAALGAGGVPMTRSATMAALDAAQARAEELDEPVRLVVVASGNDDDVDDSAFADRLSAAKKAGVTVALVQLGDGPHDAVLDKHAETTTSADEPGKLAAAVGRASATE